LVGDKDRGLTRQRNFGIARTAADIEIVCFLDDDTLLEPDYFAQLIQTYQELPQALGVGGYITNEVQWEQITSGYGAKENEFVFDGWKRKEASRFIARKKLGLDTNVAPGFQPDFAHGRSIGFFPPSGKIYPSELLIGCTVSFRKSVFDSYAFSEYFEGYGLYEDADFSVRVAKSGNLYINTKARLAHFHDASGRPNKYSYGKMVVRNGWYLWRVKTPNPSIKAHVKWHSITILLTIVRFSNIFTTTARQEAVTEFLGRVAGWFSLFFNKPKITSYGSSKLPKYKI
jgi:GT2 family glycosyltransferase